MAAMDDAALSADELRSVEEAIAEVEGEVLPIWGDELWASCPDNFHCVLEDELYLGGKEVPPEQLRAAGITHIVRVLDEDSAPLLPDRELRGYLSVRAVDSWQADLRPHFPKVRTFIADALAAEGRAYVHCGMGRSRSTAMVLAYMVGERGMTLRTAFSHVLARRDVSLINFGFLAQLVDLDQETHGVQSLPLLAAFLVLVRRDPVVAGDGSRELDAAEVLALLRNPRAPTREASMARIKVRASVLELRTAIEGRALSPATVLRPVDTRCGEQLLALLKEGSS